MSPCGDYVIKGISIHALREEGDFPGPLLCPLHGPISIHALREEGDRLETCIILPGVKFQSTPSVRRATRQDEYSLDSQLFQSTPSVRRATHKSQPDNLPFQISIHALREEGDQARLAQQAKAGRFQSTPSVRRATA